MKEYYTYSVDEFLKAAKIPVEILAENEAIFKKIADIMVETIQDNNRKNDKTVMICPVGPVGQYKYLVERINQEKISLKNVWFINMDEYLDEAENWIAEENKLSFRGFMKRNVYDCLDGDLVMPESQRVFPDPHHLDDIPQLIEKLGKVDLAVGGIGINGHVAFNEANGSLSNEDFLQQKTRKLTITPETRTSNAIGDLHGALEDMPKECVTIGISEINSAKKIILGCFRDWHKAVVRRATCGEASSEFPVTLLQQHENIKLYITDFVADMGE